MPILVEHEKSFIISVADLKEMLQMSTRSHNNETIFLLEVLTFIWVQKHNLIWAFRICMLPKGSLPALAIYCKYTKLWNLFIERVKN